MEEMYRLLKHRPKLSGSGAEASGMARPESPAPSPIQRSTSRGPVSIPLEDLSLQVDDGLRKALQNQEDTETGIHTLKDLLISVRNKLVLCLRPSLTYMLERMSTDGYTAIDRACACSGRGQPAQDPAGRVEPAVSGREGGARADLHREFLFPYRAI